VVERAEADLGRIALAVGEGATYAGAGGLTKLESGTGILSFPAQAPPRVWRDLAPGAAVALRCRLRDGFYEILSAEVVSQATAAPTSAPAPTPATASTGTAEAAEEPAPPPAPKVAATAEVVEVHRPAELAIASMVDGSDKTLKPPAGRRWLVIGLKITHPDEDVWMRPTDFVLESAAGEVYAIVPGAGAKSPKGPFLDPWTASRFSTKHVEYVAAAVGTAATKLQLRVAGGPAMDIDGSAGP
jgi:hypothetical protein